MDAIFLKQGYVKAPGALVERKLLASGLALSRRARFFLPQVGIMGGD